MACDDGRIEILDEPTSEPILSLRGHEQLVGRLVWNPDGKRLASWRQYRVKVWDAESGREVCSLSGCRFPIVWSPDGRLLATATQGHRIH